jgi:hypothetical protein
MSTIVTRAGKGSQLSWNEVDNNFTNLNTDKIQSSNAGSTGQVLTKTSGGAEWATPAGGSSIGYAILNSNGDSLSVTGNGSYQTVSLTLNETSDPSNFISTITNGFRITSNGTYFIIAKFIGLDVQFSADAGISRVGIALYNNTSSSNVSVADISPNFDNLFNNTTTNRRIAWPELTLNNIVVVSGNTDFIFRVKAATDNIVRFGALESEEVAINIIKIA